MKKVVLVPSKATICCNGVVTFVAVLDPADESIMVSIDGAGQHGDGLGSATLEYKPGPGDCGQSDIPFTATAPGYESGEDARAR